MYVVSKASFANIPPVTLGLLRLLIGGITLSILLWFANRRQSKPAATSLSQQARKRLPWLGACIAISILTQSLGANLATAHEASLLTTMTPVFIIPIAWLLLGERPRILVCIGMFIALAGVFLIVGTQDGGGIHASSLLGDAFLLIASLAWALFTVLGTPLVRASSALVVTTYGTWWSLVFFAPFAAWELLHHPGIHLSIESAASILYLGIAATALAWFLWYKGVERLPASVAAVFFFAQPLVGSFLSAIFLHESLNTGFWIGGAVLAAGILLVSW
jgi:drug/metabolite transporter (DMT)-like permease